MQRIPMMLVTALALALGVAPTLSLAALPTTLSGHWSATEQSGHGIELNILDATHATVFWATYSADGRQSWVGGLGTIDGARIVVDAYLTRGARMPGFDPRDVVRAPWGRLVLDFNSCESGQLGWSANGTATDAPTGSGQFGLSRIAARTGERCRDQAVRASAVGKFDGRWVPGTWTCAPESPDRPSLLVRQDGNRVRALFAGALFEGSGDDHHFVASAQTKNQIAPGVYETCNATLDASTSAQGTLNLTATGTCGGQATTGSATCSGIYAPAAGEPMPLPTQSVLPLLQRPFDADWPLGGYLDHEPGNDTQLTWFGVERSTTGGLGSIGYDGHGGYDWLMPEGTPVKAAADGLTLVAGEETSECPNLGTVRGLVVALGHNAPGGQRYGTTYYHLSRISVAAGQSVQAGDVIGYSGNTGCSTAPHLHLGAFRVVGEGDDTRAELIDPYGWAGPGPDPLEQLEGFGRSVWLWKPGEAPNID